MKTKKLLGLLIVLMLLIGLMAVQASAAEVVSSGVLGYYNIQWTLDDAGVLTFSPYEGDGWE